jgi:hypothetical protein
VSQKKSYKTKELFFSISVIARDLGCDRDKLFKLLFENDWITRRLDKYWELTHIGIDKGGEYRHSDDGGKWIVWPEKLRNEFISIVTGDKKNTYHADHIRKDSRVTRDISHIYSEKSVQLSLFDEYSQKGYVYLLASQSYNALKVGYTYKNPQERASQLSNLTGVPNPLNVVYYVNTSNPEIIENSVKIALKKKSFGKEFFTVPVYEAVSIIVEKIQKTNNEEIDIIIELKKAAFLINEFYDRGISPYNRRSTIWGEKSLQSLIYLCQRGLSSKELAAVFQHQEKTIKKRIKILKANGHL